MRQQYIEMLRSLGLAVLLSVLTGFAWAQSPPDAGAVLRQIEQGKPPALPRQVPAAEQAAQPKASAAAPGGVTVTVRGFRYVGNTLISPDALDHLLAPYVGRTLDLTQLRGAADAVADAYRAAGWVVRTTLPQQDITEGVVTIQIIEAVFGKVRLEGEGAVQGRAAARVMAMIEAAQPAGGLLNADRLDRALLLADDLPGITVAGRLQRGQAPGETDLALKLADEPLLSGQVSADNTGARSTGAEQVAALLRLNGPLRLGDQASAQLLHSRGSDYARLDYGLPVGYSGLRVGMNADALRYRLISPEFSALDARGSLRSFGLNTSYPLIRARQRNLFASAQYEDKRFRNDASGVRQSDYGTRVLSLGLDGNSFDELGCGGANSASLALSTGTLRLGALNAGENPALGGHFTKLNYSLSRQQVLTQSLTLYGRMSGQETASGKTLDSSEKFYLGGASGVRAYPANEGSGSRGQLLNVELRLRVNEQVSLSSFYDWGRVRNPGGGPSEALHGYGLGVAVQAPLGVRVQAFVARRDGGNPNPTVTGRDQDGSLKRNRLWLTASVPF